MLAYAGWERGPDRPKRAETAFAIAEAKQHNRLGTILLGQLTQAAGVAVLSAVAPPQNHRMIPGGSRQRRSRSPRTIPGVVLVELPSSLSPAALERFEPASRR